MVVMMEKNLMKAKRSYTRTGTQDWTPTSTARGYRLTPNGFDLHPAGVL